MSNRTLQTFPAFLSALVIMAASVTILPNAQCDAQATSPTPGASTGQPAQTANRAPVLAAKFEQIFSTKSAKPGDAVTAKTAKDLKLQDLDIPKGSKLMGSITSVKSAKEGNGSSTLAIKFDRLQLKNGAILHVQGLIVAIGAISNSPGLGSNSVLGRGGVGSTVGLDPSLALGNTGARDDIPPGSTLTEVALGLKFDTNGATVLRGIHREIKIDTDVMIKVALYRTS
jgi:hypothetical protein